MNLAQVTLWALAGAGLGAFSYELKHWYRVRRARRLLRNYMLKPSDDLDIARATMKTIDEERSK